MPKKSKQLEDADVLRDKIADAIIDYQNTYPGLRVVLNQEYAFESPARTSIGQLSVDVVANDGTFKATTFRSLKE